MPAVPRSLLKIGASYLAARSARRLKGSEDPAAAQSEAFGHLTARLSKGFIWARLGVEPGMAYEAFRSRVPLQSYDDLAPHIERMKVGAKDVLWPGHCNVYCGTTGTDGGKRKQIPMTEDMMEHFRRAGLDSILWYTSRSGTSRIFNGRHLLLGGSTALTPIPTTEAFQAYEGDLSGISAHNLPRWAEQKLYEPGTEIAQIANWPEKVAAIVKRTVGLDITLFGGMPDRALALAESIRAAGALEGRGRRTLQEVWPNLECFVHWGIPADPFQDELRAILGQTVNFHEIYPSTEAFVAAQDATAPEGLRLMADAGVFFEFVPMADFDASRLKQLGKKAVPLTDVAVNTDYALVLTTPSGFARYVPGDIVRFVSVKPARITYAGRTGLVLNAFEEHVTEREVTEALVSTCRRNGWTIVNFHVAPLATEGALGRVRARHEWWVELKAGTIITPTGPVMAPELDMELMRLNPIYQAKRTAGALDRPFVRLVMPGVFEQWSRFHGRWEGQSKMPRCKSDRVIADELGAALQFAED
jgi:hypothetical protein